MHLFMHQEGKLPRKGNYPEHKIFLQLYMIMTGHLCDVNVVYHSFAVRGSEQEIRGFLEALRCLASPKQTSRWADIIRSAC